MRLIVVRLYLGIKKLTLLGLDGVDIYGPQNFNALTQACQTHTIVRAAK
jgi:hypothetical protein